jgi:ubiquinone biosynthesis protein UbiJ
MSGRIGDQTAEKRGASLVGLADFLRREHPSNTAYHVEALTGVSATTVKHWLAGSSAPSLHHFVRLMRVYGPSLVAAVCPRAPRWLDEAHRADELRKLEEQQAALAARMEQLRGRP